MLVFYLNNNKKKSLIIDLFCMKENNYGLFFNEGGGVNTQLVNHLAQISVHYLQSFAFAYSSSNASQT